MPTAPVWIINGKKFGSPARPATKYTWHPEADGPRVSRRQKSVLKLLQSLQFQIAELDQVTLGFETDVAAQDLYLPIFLAFSSNAGRASSIISRTSA